jgi:tetratricopeptide (TPR) repeat protein
MLKMDRFFIVRILMLFSFLILHPSLSYADMNDDLREAIAVGNIEQTKFSIESGADVNFVYNDESTPLMEAVEKSDGSTAIVTLLLKSGANPKFKRSGLSPLSVALRANNDAVIKLLSPFAADETESYGLALFYRTKNENNSALEFADKTLKFNPINSDAWDLKGSIFLAQKNMKDAEAAYKRAFETSLENLKTNGSQDNYGASIWYAILGNIYKEALRVAKEAASLYPENSNISMNMGHALLLLGSKQEAISAYRRSYNEYKLSEESENHAAKLFVIDFSQLKERYPDKISLFEWAEKRLLEPFDFTYGEIPFDEHINAVLNSVEGAAVQQDETVSIGIADTVLTKQFGEGLQIIEQDSRLNPRVVQKYIVKYDKWDAIGHIDLYFTVLPGQNGQSALFVVSKSYKAQHGTIDAIFNTRQETILNELKVKPAVHSAQVVSPSGPAPVKLAIWELNDKTVILDVFSDSSLSPSIQSRIIYISKKGWARYLSLNSLPTANLK